MLYVLTQELLESGVSVGQMGLMSIFGAAPPCVLCSLLTYPSSPCLAPALLKTSFFSLHACGSMISKAQGGRWKALLGAGGSGLVLLPVLILWFACLAFGTAAQERNGDGGLV